MKTGYSRFPQAGVPRLDFRCRSNANDGNKLPRTYPAEFPPIKKDTQGVYIKGIQPFPASGNFINCSDGIRSATLFLFACYQSTPFILLSFLLFHCRFHAGVANNRFIGYLVGLLLLLYMASFASRLPTRSNPLSATSK